MRRMPPSATQHPAGERQTGDYHPNEDDVGVGEASPMPRTVDPENRPDPQLAARDSASTHTRTRARARAHTHLPAGNRP